MFSIRIFIRSLSGPVLSTIFFFFFALLLFFTFKKKMWKHTQQNPQSIHRLCWFINSATTFTRSDHCNSSMPPSTLQLHDQSGFQFPHVTSCSRFYSGIKFMMLWLSLKAVNYLISSHATLFHASSLHSSLFQGSFQCYPYQARSFSKLALYSPNFLAKPFTIVLENIYGLHLFTMFIIFGFPQLHAKFLKYRIFVL